MTEKTGNWYRLYALSLPIACLLLAMVPMHDSFGEQLSASLKVTLAVFAVARGLNAVISVVQGTEMSIEPMGVGVTLTPGQVLDPLNDIIEQFSSILLIASASQGVQNIILLLSDNWLVRIALIILAVLVLWSTYRKGIKNFPLKLLIALTLLRLTVPVIAITSYQVQSWLSEQREQAVHILGTTHADIELINAETNSKSSWIDNLRDRLDISSQLNAVKDKAEKGVEAAVYLIAEFVLVSVLLPLLFIYLVIRLIRCF